MTDTPQFTVRLRGYDREQVLDFISRVKSMQAKGGQEFVLPDFTVVLRGFDRKEVDAYFAAMPGNVL